jgi:hypothetical protein
MTNTLPVTSGLVGWYKGENWNGTSWPDSSGSGNNVTIKVGTIKTQGRFIYGGTGDNLTFPTAILPTTYTLFHIAKYNGVTRGRIFNGSSNIWFSGFWIGLTGVAFHGGLLTQFSTSAYPTGEVLLSTDQKGLYRGNGVNLKTTTVAGVNTRLTINTGTETSDWAVSEVIVYNRELSLAEIESVEAYLDIRKEEIDMQSIQSNLGGSNPISIDEYYGATGYAPTSGTISLNTFRRLAQVPIVGIPPKNLQVFLDASDSRSYPGSGTTWFDISGNGRNGTWTSVDHQGTFFETNGRSCTGPPSDSFGITNTSGYTVFIVFNQNALTQSGAFKFYTTNNTINFRAIFAHATWSDGNIYFDQGGCCASDTRTVNALTNPTATWHSVAVVRETGSNTRHIYIDGSLAITNTAAAADINLSTTSVDYVGDTTNYPGAWNAKSRCFLAYNRGLTLGEISSLHKVLIPEQSLLEASGTWTHIAVPYYFDGVLRLQDRWRINPRIRTDTSLYSHGPAIPSQDWPTTIAMREGYLTPTEYYTLSGTSIPASPEYPTPVGVVLINNIWTKTANQIA